MKVHCHSDEISEILSLIRIVLSLQPRLYPDKSYICIIIYQIRYHI